VEIKIKWIKRKQMTHENTYRDDRCILVVQTWTQIRKKEEEAGPTLSRGILAIYILYDILAEGDICFAIHYLD
jgi:hypothetical protein